MPLSVSQTKITIPPRRPELISRDRLTESLHDLLEKKLVLISAPAGYGKTSLLIDLAGKSEIPLCWLSLDELDQDPQRFILYFIASLAQVFPQFGRESLAALENLTSFERESETALITITNEIREKIHEHFAIILDDYHFVDHIPEIRSFTNRFLQLAGENVHLILASRTLPSVEDLHLLIARDLVAGISFEELAFLPDEIQAYFERNSSQPVTAERAAELAREAEGWITAIHLMDLSPGLKRTGWQTSPVAGRTTELFNFFAREVLEKQPPELREFLLLTAVFDEFDPQLCAAVMDPVLAPGQHDWASLFARVQLQNLFTIPLGVDGRSIRYHHLFHEFLEAQSQLEMPALAARSQQQLARVYEEQRKWEEAHFIYEKLGDDEGLAALIESAGTYFIRGGRLVTLANWLERLPIALLQQHPRLLSLQGTVYFTQGDTQMGVSLLSQAEVALRTGDNTESLALTLVRRAVAYRYLGEYHASLMDADEAISLTHENPASEMQAAYAEGLRVKGLALYRLGRVNESIGYLEKSLHLFGFLEETESIPILEMEIGMVQRALGNHRIAVTYYDRALAAWEHGGNLGWQALLLNNLGVLYHLTGAYDASFKALEDSLHSAERCGYVHTQALALCSMGDLLVDIQEFDRALECYRNALSIAAQTADSFIAFYATLAQAQIARLSGDLSSAKEIIQNLRVNLAGPADYEEALFSAESGCYLLYTHAPREAIMELTRALQLFERESRVLEACTCRVWRAAALSAVGEGGACTAELDSLGTDAQSLKEPHALYSALNQAAQWLEPVLAVKGANPVVQSLAVQAARFQEELPGLRRKLRQISQRINISPPHLAIRALGTIQVTRNGKSLTLADWQTRETRDLFLFLLQSGPQKKDEIASVFWPEISPARLKMRFKTTMYRLRQAVGTDAILFEDDRYRFNQAVDYECDTETFEALIHESESQRDSAALIRALQAAVDLVRGPFLADSDAEWAMPERTRIETLYQAALLQLSSLYLAAGQPDKSLSTSRIALTSDPLLEEAHRLSMRAHAALRDRAAIVRQFEQCSDLLDRELGVKPSRETEVLYRQLIR